jgi:perosamine synthetase
MAMLHVPFFRPDLSEPEIDEVVATLRSGWLTTGPRTHRFEQAFAAAVHAPRALAVNSCTAALHLAVEAHRLDRGHPVLVPTMTFAATAEVIRYHGGIPILVDCDPVTLNMDLADAERKLEALASGRLASRLATDDAKPVGIVPVHVGGVMMDIAAVHALAKRHHLWVVEDAAHAFPAAWRPAPGHPWQRCGEGTAEVSCFSFYANKTITTGEGGMAVSYDAELDARMRVMALHGLSKDAWDRYSAGGTWDYRIVAPGYKYNLTDIAAAIGIHQLARAERMRQRREAIALRYLDELAALDEIELPPQPANRIHAWHLFPLKLRLERLSIDRAGFIDALHDADVSCSVHWRPLHLHPYYQNTFGWTREDLPAASAVWERLVSLPIFSSMTDEEVDRVVRSVQTVCRYAAPLHLACAADG